MKNTIKILFLTVLLLTIGSVQCMQQIRETSEEEVIRNNEIEIITRLTEGCELLHASDVDNGAQTIGMYKFLEASGLENDSLSYYREIIRNGKKVILYIQPDFLLKISRPSLGKLIANGIIEIEDHLEKNLPEIYLVKTYLRRIIEHVKLIKSTEIWLFKIIGIKRLLFQIVPAIIHFLIIGEEEITIKILADGINIFFKPLFNVIGAREAIALAVGILLPVNGIDSQGATAIAEALPSSFITTLKFNRSKIPKIIHNQRYNQISDDGATAIAEILHFSTITDLNITLNRIGPEGATAIAETLSSSSIIILDLSWNHIGDEGVIAIATALPYFSLESLNIGFNDIGDAGAQAIGLALPNSSITTIGLEYNDIGDIGVIAIAAALPYSSLTTIDLILNDIGDIGAKAIAESLSSSSLIKLNLNINNIGDEGATTIAASLPRSSLTTLNLSSNNIGDERIRTIAAALPYSSLVCMKQGNINLIYNAILLIFF